MNAQSPQQTTLSAALMSAILLVSGLLLPGLASADSLIPIRFDAGGCPQPGVPNIDTSRGKKIEWQAYDLAGNRSRQEFMLYFDPLKGATLKAPNGKVSKPIDTRAPIATYKYTVVGKGCENQPLDPNIRVNN